MASSNRKPVILHIDDDPIVREIIGEALGKAGMDMRDAGGILDGIQSALQDAPDLILLDLHMPDGDGYEACQAFRAIEKLSSIPIVLLTGMHGGEHSKKTRACEASEVVKKPCDSAHLVSIIRKWLPPSE